MVIFLTRKDGVRIAVQYEGSMAWVGRGAMCPNAQEIEEGQAWLEREHPEAEIPPDAFRKAVLARMSAFR